MSASIIQRSADPFTDATIAKLYLDPVLNKGSMYLFDFLNPTSNPNPDGVLASGATFRNLVDGGADGVYAAATGGNSASIGISNAANKGGIVSTGQTGNIATSPTITLGAPTAAIGSDEALIILWLKTNGNSYIGGSYLIDGLDVAPAAGQLFWAYSIYAAVNAQTIQAGTRMSGAGIIGPTVAAKPGAVRQIGLSISGGMTRIYENGALAGAMAGAANPIPATGMSPRLLMNGAGTFYRAYMERLTLSGRSALAAVQADYALNNARFADK
jgi:hypothetical protein